MDAYTVLGVQRGASQGDIKAAYRHRMMACHPDVGGSEDEAKLVNRAYEILMKRKPEPIMVFYQRPVVRVVFTSGTRRETWTW